MQVGPYMCCCDFDVLCDCRQGSCLFPLHFQGWLHGSLSLVHGSYCWVIHELSGFEQWKVEVLEPATVHPAVYTVIAIGSVIGFTVVCVIA